MGPVRLRIWRLTLYKISNCWGSAIEGFTSREFIVLVGNSKAEAVVVVARDEVEMKVEYLLARGLSIGDKPVDAIASEGFVERLCDLAGNGKEVGGGPVF